jgi:ABC-type Fe3+-siderophore transport system permease subunit
MDHSVETTGGSETQPLWSSLKTTVVMATLLHTWKLSLKMPQQLWATIKETAFMGWREKCSDQLRTAYQLHMGHNLRNLEFVALKLPEVLIFLLSGLGLSLSLLLFWVKLRRPSKDMFNPHILDIPTVIFWQWFWTLQSRPIRRHWTPSCHQRCSGAP